MKKQLSETEEQWAEIMRTLKNETHAIYEEASDLFNLKYTAKISAKGALNELMGALKTIGEATYEAKHTAVIYATEYGYTDTHIANQIGLHRHTVRRWRQAHEKWQDENTLSQAEVEELTQPDGPPRPTAQTRNDS